MNIVGYSKMAQNAIAAISCLAEKHGFSLSRSAEIAEKRNLPLALVAKILTILSQAGLVEGMPGPQGGYRLSRPPKEIRFYDVVRLFDKVEGSFPCPFGASYCPSANPCPVHDEIVAMRRTLDTFLKGTHFGDFAAPTERAHHVV